jgi:hypothetical protein
MKLCRFYIGKEGVKEGLRLLLDINGDEKYQTTESISWKVVFDQ